VALKEHVGRVKGSYGCRGPTWVHYGHYERDLYILRPDELDGSI